MSSGAAALGVAGETTRVSVASDGTQANGDSYFPSLSADGRFVAFRSHASNLVVNDTNGAADVFVHDRQAGQTTRVSVASNGTQGNSHSGVNSSPSISSDGRFVAFYSVATNLVTGDTNGVDDVFVHDRQTGQTERVNVASDGAQSNATSIGGLGYDGFAPALSADGRFVAFISRASNLVANDANATFDIFVRDRQLGQTTRVSMASDGAEANGFSAWPAISPDGRSVAFVSNASNLVVNDTNGAADVFVHDRQTGQTTRVSVASDGTQGNSHSGINSSPSISADARFVVFYSASSNLHPNDTDSADDVFVHDRQTGQTMPVSVASDGTPGNGFSGLSAITADGRVVVFQSNGNNLVPNDTNGAVDVFVHDRQTGQTTRVSVATDGTQGNHNSNLPFVSADGRFVAYSSFATNLVDGDTNSAHDVFVHDFLGEPAPPPTPTPTPTPVPGVGVWTLTAIALLLAILAYLRLHRPGMRAARRRRTGPSS